MIKSYIPAANAPSKIEINSTSSKDKNPRKRKVINSRNDLIHNRNIQEEVLDITNDKNVEEVTRYNAWLVWYELV